uniref:NAD(P)-dependent alcohol dehydrogenase n=1 Tax=uncultured Altererythrobacter sp. TaxID=500840 RepID=UPI00262F71BD|nr:NAD(P)-dependent alcohol dehydrogenase [uncultured Altererythrobacter sp.]
MRALTLIPPSSGKGQPDLQIIQAPKPTAASGEVLVRVHFAGLQYMDYEAWQGDKNKALAKARKNGSVVSGIEMSGVVESDGYRLKRGDKVFGYTNIFKGPFYHAEYVAVSEDKLAILPDGMTLQGAASIVGGGLTALAALERIAGLKAGENVLITGATGSVGTTAVQLAKHLGANVAGVCHSSQMTFARSLGADEAYAYDRGELPPAEHQFDVVFDAAAALKFAGADGFLTPQGRYITTMPHLDVGGFLKSLFSRRKWGFLLVSDTDRERMERLRSLIAAGAFRDTIEKIFPLAIARDAFNHQQGTGKGGKILLDLIS